MRILLVGVLVAVVGLTLGGVVRAVTASDAPAEVSVATGAAGVHDCPTGEVLDSYSSGSRVYAVARTESSEWVQVRDLAAPDKVVRISAANVELDDDISSLPVGECPEYDGAVTALSDTTTTTAGDTTTTSSSTTTTVASTTTSSSTTTTSTTAAPPDSTVPPTTPPPTTPPPTTPPDTTPPVIQQPSVAPAEIWEEDTNFLSCPATNPRKSEVSVIVTDHVGVASVRASWTIGGTADSATLGLSQGVYTMTFGPYESPTVTDKAPYGEDVTITIRALDAAGNESKIALSVRVNSVWECFG